MRVKNPLSPRNVEDLPAELGVDLRHGTVKRHGKPRAIVTDGLRSYTAAPAPWELSMQLSSSRNAQLVSRALQLREPSDAAPGFYSGKGWAILILEADSKMMVVSP